MRLFFYMLLAFMLAQYTVVAQGGNRLTGTNYQQKANDETENMVAKLHLSTVQRDSVAIINMAYYQQLVTLQSLSLTITQRQQQYAQAEEWRRSRLAQQLLSTQMAQYVAAADFEKTRWQHKIDSLKAARSGQ